MKRVENTNTEFLCEAIEKVTITITPHNTEPIFTCDPQNSDVKLAGNVVTINIGGSTKSVTLGFDFNGNGGSYRMVLTGSAGGSFNRGVIQPSDDLPAMRSFTFHV